MLVLQNRQNVCFPSKGWLSWRTGSISQETLRQLSATACSCGGRSLITQACCCSCPPSTSSAEDSTGEVWGGWLCAHWTGGVEVADHNGSSVTFSAHSWSGQSNATTGLSFGNPVARFNVTSFCPLMILTLLRWWTYPCFAGATVKVSGLASYRFKPFDLVNSFLFFFNAPNASRILQSNLTLVCCLLLQSYEALKGIGKKICRQMLKLLLDML